jgi:hypothetical protein
MYRRITMTAIMLTLLGGLAPLGGRARQTHATPQVWLEYRKFKRPFAPPALHGND